MIAVLVVVVATVVVVVDAVVEKRVRKEYIDRIERIIYSHAITNLKARKRC